VKISVITPSFNQAGFIEQTMTSVLSQNGGFRLEYWIIDGGSEDGTTDILMRLGEQVSWISEKDDGLADAVNKGLDRVTGDIIGWLNSDDLYLPGALNSVALYFELHPGVKWVYGKCRIIDDRGNEIWNWITRYKNLNLRRFSFRRLLTENYISQPAVFIRKEVFAETGKLDTQLKYAMDYDLWLRIGKKYPAGVITSYLSSFRRHPSSKSERGYMEQFREQYRVACRYTKSWTLLAMHQFNIHKIITSYLLMNKFRTLFPKTRKP
jgi:glycosyltransferase involved in cell wall biosynthesis